MMKVFALTLAAALALSMACGDTNGANFAGQEQTATQAPPRERMPGDPFMPSMYMVGADIEPGLYTGVDGCYWRRMDETGRSDVATGSPQHPFHVMIDPTDGFFFSTCRVWSAQEIPPREPVGEQYFPGMYLVGPGVVAGTYAGRVRAEDTEGCTWRRLRSVTGDPALDVVVEGRAEAGAFEFAVDPTDFAVETTCQFRAAP